MAGFLSAAVAAIGSSSIGSALVRILVAYGVSRLINGATGEKNQQQIDEGIRLQLQPDTTNPIPLLYGSAYFGGNITDVRLADDNQTLWVCLTLSEHTAATTTLGGHAVDTFIEEIYYNDQLIEFKADGITIDYATNTDGSIDTSPRDLVKIYLYKNGSNAPTLPYDFLGGTLPGNAYTLMPGWDSDWRMEGLTFALIKIIYNRDKGITGIPNLKFKVSNTLYRPGDALYDYMTNTISGADLVASQIDTASLLTLNDYADDEVVFFNEDTNTTETLGDRYQINGVINPQQNVLANMQEIANSTGVYINYDITSGKWGVILDKTETPAYAFDDSNVVGGIDVTATSLDNVYSSVEVEFPSRFIQDQTDTIRIDLPVEYLNDNQPENVLQVRLSMLNEPLQARELAYLALYQNTLDRVVTFTTDYSKIQVAAGDVITLTNSIYGFSNQPFRVVRVKEIESDVGSILVEITAQEYDSTLYTAGGQPRRPRTPSSGLDLTPIKDIATPNAPTYTTANNNRQPSILLSGVVPTGVVDRFEFWYSTDDFATSFLIHEEKNANGAPFNSDTTIIARVATLPAGTYKFKVRAGNEQAYSDYSAASTELEWAPNQTTDEVNQNSTLEFGLGDLLPAIGAGILGYLAYQLIDPQKIADLLPEQLRDLLGLQTTEEAAALKAQMEAEGAAFRIVNAGNVQLAASSGDETLTFVAGTGIEITADDIGHEITITATGGDGFNTIEANGQNMLSSVTDGVLTLNADTGIAFNVDAITNTITIGATGEADAINAYSRVVAGGTTLDASVTSGNLYLTPGNGIKFTSNANTNTIIIDNTCCGDDVDTTSFKDGGKPIITELDDPSCKVIITWPTKNDIERTPEVPAVPQTWIKIIAAGTWYDHCYRTTVPTLILDDPDNIIDIEIGDSTTLTGKLIPTTTGQIDWKDTVGSVFIDKTIKLKKVAENEYVAIKNWASTDGSALPLTGDVCNISDPWSRPLFTTIDYPNGYEFATKTNLTNLLVAEGSALRFIYVAAIAAIPASDTPVAYPGKQEVTRLPRTCVKTLETTVAIAKIDFQGTISDDVLWLAPETPGETDWPEIPLGSTITGSFTSISRQTIILENTTVISQIAGNRYQLNKTYPTLTTVDDSTMITMYFSKSVIGTIAAADELSVDYNTTDEDFGVVA